MGEAGLVLTIFFSLMLVTIICWQFCGRSTSSNAMSIVHIHIHLHAEIDPSRSGHETDPPNRGPIFCWQRIGRPSSACGCGVSFPAPYIANSQVTTRRPTSLSSTVSIPNGLLRGPIVPIKTHAAVFVEAMILQFSHK
jgi:hypothetical protein